MMMLDRKPDVLAAAAHLVEMYSNGDVEGYLACFVHDASFIFYCDTEIFESRDEWASEFVKLIAEGHQVISCTSSNQRVQMLGDNAAIFYHDVKTVETDGDGNEETLLERETIIFFRHGEKWLAVHEHLSAQPAPTPVT